jgi:hypothetical protein
MASQPVLPEQPLTREQGWELFASLRGVLKESYARLGGAEKVHREEREAWNEASDRG